MLAWVVVYCCILAVVIAFFMGLDRG